MKHYLLLIALACTFLSCNPPSNSATRDAEAVETTTSEPNTGHESAPAATTPAPAKPAPDLGKRIKIPKEWLLLTEAEGGYKLQGMNYEGPGGAVDFESLTIIDAGPPEGWQLEMRGPQDMMIYNLTDFVMKDAANFEFQTTQGAVLTGRYLDEQHTVCQWEFYEGGTPLHYTPKIYRDEFIIDTVQAWQEFD